MTTEQTRQQKAATECANCNCPFTSQNHKVKHHSHLTGEYLFPACNNCNLQLKPKKCKVKDADQDANSYTLAIVFHNLQRYDFHFVIKHFKKRYSEKVTKGQKVSFDDVNVILLNGERFLQFQIGNLKFLDSFQFLSTFLENLVSLLLKNGKENFPHTTKYLNDTPYTFAKGIYPYSYVDCRARFDETKLPSIENFCNTLTDEPLSIQDYERAQEIWAH